jgi:hypothetical protein
MLPLVARSHSGCQDGCSFCWLLSPVGLPSAAHCWNWNWRAVFLRHCAVASHLGGFLWLTCLDLAPTLVRIWHIAPPPKFPAKPSVICKSDF